MENGRVRPLTDADCSAMHRANDALASQGVRVLGVGLRGLTAAPVDQDPQGGESDLVFLGLVGMIDPPRPEARIAVARCRTAAIRAVMVTGDHPDTARYIAADLGMTTPAGRVVTGVERERVSDADLQVVLQDPDANCFDRVSLERKLRIVGALQALGHVVAMTGDGVNDAPALKRADIGVAISPLIGLVAMLKPIQILVSNLFTDGLLGLGMGMEAAERNTMSRPPYSPSESIFSRGMGRHIAIIGLLPLVLGHLQWRLLGLPNVLTINEEAVRDRIASSPEVLLWGTLMFTALALMQVGRALSSRSFSEPFWRQPPRTNKVLMGMIVAVIVLQMLVVYAPGAQAFFARTALSMLNLLLCVGIALTVLAIMGVLKEVERRL
jgi:Ca2+-transporting ATPase